VIFYDPVRAVIAFVAEYLYLVVVAAECLYLVLHSRKQWKELLGVALFIGFVAFGISLIANQIIQDPRPFVVSGLMPLIRSSSDNGFPSDHALLLGSTAAIVSVASPIIGLFGLLAALIVGIARVYAGVHHLVDVLGSLIIALVALGAYKGLMWAWSVFRRHTQQKKL
jgi:membrane-associated phospholipid phosphatase